MLINSIIFFILGLIFGDFLNAFVGRLQAGEDWIRGRSYCDNCKKTLQPVDLIPVISWVMLQGKCRYCGKKVPWEYPLIEVITGILFAVSYIFWPYGFGLVGVVQFIVWLIVLVGFVAQSIYDLKWRELHTIITDVSIGLVLVSKTIEIVYTKDFSLLQTMFFGVLIGAGIFYFLYRISHEKWIGGGDVRLGILFGLLVGGPLNSALIISISSILGTLISLPMMVLGKMNSKSTLPFGPLLIIATIAVYIGKDLIDSILKALYII